MAQSQYSKILVFQTAFLGDLFLSIPLLQKIKVLYPQAEIGLVCRKNFGQFFLSTGLVDQVFEIDKRSQKSLQETFKATKNYHPDLIVSPHLSFRTALWVKKLSASESIGFYKPWNFWAYKKRVMRDLSQHDVLRQLSLLEPLGLVVDESDQSLHSSLKVPSPDKFGNISQSIAVAPGSQWETKRWPVEYFSDVIKKLLAEGKKVILVGGPDEREIAKQIVSQIPSVKNLVGETSILELAQVLSQCRLLVTNDSGAMHVATSVGTPVVSIFGPTVPAQGYSPWSKKSEIVEMNPLACRPCGAHGHHRCPLGTHDCMKKLEPEKVLKAVDRVLS